jgi:hypothetical protein
MVMKPLAILKKGLIKLFQSTKTRNDEIQAKLSQSETLSLVDEQWLDNDGHSNDQPIYDRLSIDSGDPQAHKLEAMLSTLN